MSREVIMIKDEAHRAQAAIMVRKCKVGTRIEFRESGRSLPQNDLMWQRLTDLHNQVEWHGLVLSPEDWKDVMTAGLRKSRVIPNLDGDGFVQLGLHTSKMTKDEMTALLDLIDAFGAERGVRFTDQQDSDSSDATPPPNSVETDAPAGAIPTPAGDPLPSRLSEDWRIVYMTCLSRPDDGDDLRTRHKQALQMLGGTPYEYELAWMRRVYTLVRNKNRGLEPYFERERDRLMEMTLPPAESR